MKRLFTVAGLAWRIWVISSLFVSLILTVLLYNSSRVSPLFMVLFFAGAAAASIPAFITLLIILPAVRKLTSDASQGIFLLSLFTAFIAAAYGVVAGFIMHGAFGEDDLKSSAGKDILILSISIFACIFFSILILLQPLRMYFSKREETSALSEQNIQTSNTSIMEDSFIQAPAPAANNRLLIKGLITGGLILLMWIPTLFIQSLVNERAMRQQEIVKEVSSKWADAQTVSGPFLSVPYKQTETGSKGEQLITKTHLIITAENMEMNGKIIPEQRPRSIYKVLLYRSELNFSGNFKPHWPEDINPANLDLAHAKLCFTLSDFKGIEDDAVVNFGGEQLALEPGVPVNDLGATGLSSPVNLTNDSLGAGVPVTVQIKIKGSGLLHFLPLGSKSKFLIHSSWPDPSFDGNVLPAEREISDSGFTSRWNFNRANSSFGSVIREGNFPAVSTAFGVSLVQPADQYNKTMRCVKYAILFIGLTFALFFIIEIMQKKPLHPVQYALTGVALVIFYSLLLSISEFILFDHAYLISAAATVLLITFYAKGHFKNWRSAGIMGGLLAGLYSFIFVLIRLEDTALLVGSIGLFVILALVMYASRKINWYGHAEKENNLSAENQAVKNV